MRFRYMLVSATALALASCNQDQSADRSAIERQLREQEAQWQRDYAAKDAAALASHYADDAALASPGAAIVTSKDERTAALQALAKDSNLKMEFASDRIDVAASGDLAYTRGKFTMQTTDPTSSQPRIDKGSYLTIWKKQSDGSWKAVEDFVTPGPAVPPAA
jgi:ketosteroid isomerase-like protein